MPVVVAAAIIIEQQVPTDKTQHSHTTQRAASLNALIARRTVVFHLHALTSRRLLHVHASAPAAVAAAAASMLGFCGCCAAQASVRAARNVNLLCAAPQRVLSTSLVGCRYSEHTQQRLCRHTHTRTHLS